MGILSNLVNDLKQTIIGTKTSKIDKKLDQTISDITIYKSNTERNSYIDLIKNLISKSDNFDLNHALTGSMVSSESSIASLGQNSRMARYKSYESIVNFINYCQRALNILTDNILSPDDINKSSLDINTIDNQNDIKTTSYVRLTKQIIKEIKLEDHLNNIIHNTLKYGDLFCEIASEKIILTGQSILSEAQQMEKFGDIFFETDKVFFKDDQGNDLELKITYHNYNEAKETNKSNKSNKSNKKKFSDFKLLLHQPHHVVKLETETFPICLGYLIFPKTTFYSQYSMQEKTLNNICVDILKKIERHVPDIKNLDNQKDLKDLIAAMVSMNNDNKSMNIRFVPPDKMVHFKIDSMTYKPYGESIFDKSVFSAKILIALETALAVQRLSRSTEKRKIAMEIGLPRDAAKVIENLKEEFRKRKITLDSTGGIDTIPSMISTFEDIYIPMKDGKRFVEIESMNDGNVDVRSKVDELKFMRDSVIGNLSIPAAFLGLEESLSNKAALSEENIIFARTIITYQKMFTGYVNELLHKVINLINPEDSLIITENIFVNFPSPKSLQFERESRYISDISNMIRTLEELGIPRDYLTQRYLSNFDWDEIKKYKIDDNIKKEIDPKAKKEDEMGGIGGGIGY
jgi:hypothetical protein